jgi:uncharacterized protein
VNDKINYNEFYGLQFDVLRSCPYGEFENAVICLNAGNKEQASLLLLEAEKNGDRRASYVLGLLFLKEYQDDGAVPLRRAATHMAKAAYAGVPDGCYEFAVMLEAGRGVKKNRRNAFRYFLRGALLGHLDSYYEVARHYEEGIGAKADKQVAYIWRGRGNEIYRARYK